MKQEVLYAEKQKFNQWSLWLLLLGFNSIFIYGIIRQVYLNPTQESNLMPNSGLIFALTISVLITLLFAIFRVDTLIKKDGIYVRFFPIHSKYKYYPWDKMTKSYIRTYSPISEYGGWGLRLNLFGKGKAYSTSGNQGLQLVLKSGEKILIGTQKPDEIMGILEKIGQLNP